MSDSRTFKVKRSDWILQHPVDDEIENFVAQRAGGQHFHATMVDDTFVKQDGSEGTFRQLLIFEHDQGHDKVGDVLLQFRKHPTTGRYMVQVEQENVFVTETDVKKIWRTKRSSVDNLDQALKKTVAHNGWIYSNARRQGGKPIKTHHLIAGWSPQLEDQMMDVYDYVESLDSMGLATFTKALQKLPERPARAIFKQMRTPPNGNGE